MTLLPRGLPRRAASIVQPCVEKPTLEDSVLPRGGCNRSLVTVQITAFRMVGAPVSPPQMEVLTTGAKEMFSGTSIFSNPPLAPLRIRGPMPMGTLAAFLMACKEESNLSYGVRYICLASSSVSLQEGLSVSHQNGGRSALHAV